MISTQEPGGATDIAETAQHQYGVTFPIAAKAVVKGPNAHPFYRWAAEARPRDVPRWNFHKYLIGRDGYIADVFPEPSSRPIPGSKPPLHARSLRPDNTAPHELTCSSRQIGDWAIKAVAVAARLQLGYCDQGQEWLGRRLEKPGRTRD